MIFKLLLTTMTLDLSTSAVVELGDADFKNRIAEYETALIMFYAPWCGHCKRLKPEFDLASVELAKNDPPVHLAKVDCTEGGKKICDSFGVDSYPTLKIFKNGKVQSKEYAGPRQGIGIVEYMKTQAGPGFVQIQSKEAYDKFIEGGNDLKNRVVGFFRDSPTMKRAFISTTDVLRDKFRFGITSEPELLKENNGKDGIVLFRPKKLHNIFEPSQLNYDGRPTKSAIESWLKANLHGLVDVLNIDNHEDFEKPLVVAYYSVDYENNAKITNYWRNRILKIAKNFASDFNFAISAKEQHRHEIEFDFGRQFPTSEKPIVLARDEDNRKFVMAEEFSAENFESFLKKVKNNEIESYMKSEPIPEDNSKPVKIAVAKNFDEVVINNNQDTFVELYAPWCNHCKKLSPIWDELGEKMKDEDVAIVKMNVESNEDHRPYEIDKLPTIYWAPKDEKTSPVLYTGGRELNDFVEFIAKHATNELKNYDREGRLINKKDEL